MKIKTTISILTALAIITAAFMIMNIGVSIKVGVDGHYRTVKMPLYVKWTEFLARHYEYARLAREITAGCRTDEEKALAILAWTRTNLKDIPPGTPVYDDHILNIIIRGYGAPEQFQDVFTALCSYAGLPAFFDKFYDKEHKARCYLSFVKINGKWRVFDAYYRKYFRTNDGEIAAVEDVLNNPSLVSGEGIDQIVVEGVPYRDFYSNLNLEQIKNRATLRPYRQMPLRRMIYELRKLLKLEKNESVPD